MAEQCGEKSMFSHAVFLCWFWLEKIQTLHSKFVEKLNCGNLLTLHRVYSEFFFNLNPSLHAVSVWGTWCWSCGSVRTSVHSKIRETYSPPTDNIRCGLSSGLEVFVELIPWAISSVSLLLNLNGLNSIHKIWATVVQWWLRHWRAICKSVSRVHICEPDIPGAVSSAVGVAWMGATK